MWARTYTAAVLAAWLAAMSWLVVAKVLPTLRGGVAPQQASLLPRAGETPRVEAWRLSWNDRPIGWAASRACRNDDLTAEVLGVVHFDQFPLDDILSQLLGPLARVWGRMAGGPGEFSLQVRTRTLLNEESHLQRMEAALDIDGIPNVVQMHGGVISTGRLEIVVKASLNPGGQGEAGQQELLRRTIDVPRDALVSDALSPQPRFASLARGQTWTFPVVRAFPPGNTLQIVEATAEGNELVYWEGEPVETMRVVFRNDAGSDVGAARQTLGTAWVRADGVVLRQEVALGNLRFRFDRLADGDLPPAAETIFSRL